METKYRWWRSAKTEPKSSQPGYQANQAKQPVYQNELPMYDGRPSIPRFRNDGLPGYAGRNHALPGQVQYPGSPCKSKVGWRGLQIIADTFEKSLRQISSRRLLHMVIRMHIGATVTRIQGKVGLCIGRTISDNGPMDAPPCIISPVMKGVSTASTLPTFVEGTVTPVHRTKATLEDIRPCLQQVRSTDLPSMERENGRTPEKLSSDLGLTLQVTEESVANPMLAGISVWDLQDTYKVYCVHRLEREDWRSNSLCHRLRL